MHTSIFIDGLPLTASQRIDQLTDRLAALPKASEHHIWEAYTLLECLSACRHDDRDRRYFRDLMDTSAHLEALLFLLARSRPALELHHLSLSDGVWSCRLIVGSADRSLCGAAVHPDRNAAILLALIRAAGSSAFSGGHDDA